MIGSRSAFKNREEAGVILAKELSRDITREAPLILALPRGGIPVAYEVARALKAPLDLLIVRKLGVPGQEELAMGAISSGGIQILNDQVIAQFDLSQEAIDHVISREEAELRRRELLYHGGRPFPDVEGRNVVVVDDGVATGSTMRAALELLRQQGAGRIVAAVPTAPPETVADLEKLADEVITVMTPSPFRSVGQCYRDFTQVDDLEVRHYLDANELDSNS